MKLHRHFIPSFVILIWVMIPAFLFAQLNGGGLPYAFSRAIAPDSGNFVIVTPPQLDNLAMEDQQTPLPYRFAVNLPVDLEIGSSGQSFTSSDGITIWRINIKSPGAKALILYFDKYLLPDEGRLFVYNPARTQLLGSFTSLSNNKFSTFATSMVYGDEVTLEYNAPAHLPLPDLHISEVGHAYRGVSGNMGFGGSGPCEVNVNCSEGNDWQKQKRGVARITVKKGGSSVWCTGSLVDNTRHDGKPYVLTADHCGKGATETDLSQWIFYFNYEGAGCPDPTKEPALNSLTGATLISHGGNAGSNGSDFFMVLLNTDIPKAFNVYYNGWSRETTPPSPSGIGIHHPQGDVKKISTYTSELQPAHWIGNPALAHWRVFWSGTPNGHGTTEGGSSGSPLFDNQGMLIGTLTGGDSSCDSLSLNLPDYYGMFSYHWDQNGTDSSTILKCWLDPDNTGLMSLKGWSTSVQESEMDEWVAIFPNPVKEQLNVKMLAITGRPVSISVTDILGNRLVTTDRTATSEREMKVDVSGFTPGIYFLEITDGSRRTVRKIIKQ